MLINFRTRLVRLVPGVLSAALATLIAPIAVAENVSHNTNSVSSSADREEARAPRKLRLPKTNFVQLPKIEFDSNESAQTGYYCYSSSSIKQFAMPPVVNILQEAGKKLAKENIIMGVGDMSYASGTEMKPHRSHRRGLSVDLRMISNSGVAQQGTYASPGYNQAKTFTMVKTLIDTDPDRVKMILINSPALAAQVKKYIRESYPGIRIKVGPARNHDNHIHIDWTNK